jgi:hypothetical protein
MKFDNTSIGLLLFYTAGGLLAVAFAIVYWTSSKQRRKKR